MKTLIGAIALIIAAPVAAQTTPAAGSQSPMGQMDHSTMDHSKMDHSQHMQGQHDCKACCEKMKGKDGKMECMDKAASANTSAQAHEGHAH